MCVQLEGAIVPVQAGGSNPCPAIDFTGGFNDFFAAVYDLPSNMSILNKFGKAFGALLHTTTCLPIALHVMALLQSAPGLLQSPLCTSYSETCCFADPFLNDETYVLCVLALEELGATGNKVRDILSKLLCLSVLLWKHLHARDRMCPAVVHAHCCCWPEA
jgi:hypothetical protein